MSYWYEKDTGYEEPIDVQPLFKSTSNDNCPVFYYKVDKLVDPVAVTYAEYLDFPSDVFITGAKMLKIDTSVPKIQELYVRALTQYGLANTAARKLLKIEICGFEKITANNFVFPDYQFLQNIGD